MLKSLIIRWTWSRIRNRDPRVARRLYSFARTEQGSALTLRLAAAQTESPKRQALYLHHAADEVRHARLFHGAAEALAGERKPLSADGEDVFAIRGELGFLAFVHHAERRGRKQFELIAETLSQKGPHPTADLLRSVAAEERHHEDYSWNLLLNLSGTEKDAERELHRVQRWELWRNFRRIGRTMAEPLFSALILSLFPLLLLYGAALRRGARAPRGFHSS